MRTVLLPLLALLVSLIGTAAAPAPAAAGTPRPKAVIIVGPSSGETSRYLGLGEAFADSAERYGFDVRRVYHPRATWSNVLKNIQGAKLVINLGHGNGWPSPYPPYQTDTKNGLGLNAYEGASAYATKYYGEGPIAESINLGENAIVLLSHLCYSAGNGETGQAMPTESVARQRVDNFGAGYIKAGAHAVFAYYWNQQVDFVQQLMTRDATMDQIFMTRGRGDYDGYVGGRDVRFASVRSKPYSVHMDRSDYGYLRSVVGNLGMTTGQWKAGTAPDPDPDQQAPELTGLSTTATPPATADDAVPGLVSPNGDGNHETLRLHHTLSENAWLDATIESADGTVVGRYAKWVKAGRTSHLWNGRDGTGATIPDGSYKLTMQPRDAAGNRGSRVSVAVKILTTLDSPAISHMSLFPNDGDRIASGTTLHAKLNGAANLSFRITTKGGQLAREWAPSRALAAGKYSWTWKGRDAAGQPMPTGYYQATTLVTTAAGSQSWTRTVFLGAFEVSPSDTSPRRGEKVTLAIVSTEPLAGKPSVTVTQPGVPSFTVGSESTSTPGHYEATVELRDAGTAGTGSIKITGADTGGREQKQTVKLEID